jgi:NDP-sugar pyrophosphorylase family protein
VLTILIPCAGEGRRFKEAGYEFPKPLIDVEGLSMLSRVIDNVRPKDDWCNWSFVFMEDHANHLGLAQTWSRDNPSIHWISSRTDGAARTCLEAAPYIEPREPLLIANCDQIVEGGIAPLLETDSDAAVLTFLAPNGDSKWSYAEVAYKGRVQQIVEKPQHPHQYTRATTGHYWFKRAVDFFAAARCMIEMGDSVNGEFYVAPTMNYLIAARKRVQEVRVEHYGGRFYGLGTPEDLEIYLKRKK